MAWLWLDLFRERSPHVVLCGALTGFLHDTDSPSAVPGGQNWPPLRRWASPGLRQACSGASVLLRAARRASRPLSLFFFC